MFPHVQSVMPHKGRASLLSDDLGVESLSGLPQLCGQPLQPRPRRPLLIQFCFRGQEPVKSF